jgi:TRAP-type C4-dicarboxylate transport system permease small subunit
MNSDTPLDPDAAAAIARVRKLMLVASLTTLIAVGAVLAVIGYRIFHLQGSAPVAIEAVPPLPAGARMLSMAVGDGHVVLTVEVNGAVELRSYDLTTLKPLARTALTGPR